MEPEGSLTHSQVSATCPYPEPARSSPYPHILILSFHLHLGLPSGLLPSGIPTKTMHTPLLSPIRVTCSAHPILVDFITRTILGEEYRSFSSSLCSSANRQLRKMSFDRLLLRFLQYSCSHKVLSFSKIYLHTLH